MPELPEVETVRRQLHDRIAGKRIRGISIFKTGREVPHGEKFATAVKGRKVAGVERRAKVLIFRFDDGNAVLGHLKMTGRFVFVDSMSAPLNPPITGGKRKRFAFVPGKHDRMMFVFDSGDHLVWSDVRMFGYLRYVDAKEAERQLSHYGPEPLEATAAELAEGLKRKSFRSIKATLLDQTVIAGIGNIYADEALFRAGIRPGRRTRSLKDEERLRLAKEIKAVLKASLARKGTSANDYVDTTGEKGTFKNFLKVYGRGGKPCRVCETPITKTVVAQRGTHFCKQCQS